MKFSANWLREVVNPKVTNNELVEQLTMAGLEVESVVPACINFSGVYTAEIKHVEQHPNADKLKVCTVNLNNEDLQIVCGDPTVSSGSKVALATVGAKLNNGEFKIKKSKLRGVESYGMLCSKQELGLAETSNGIWVLPNETELGLNLFEHLQLDDDIIELSLTPNRGDCFSLRGIAREAAVLNKIEFNDLVTNSTSESIGESGQESLDIKIENYTSCPRYVGRIITGLNSNARTPDWMQERLRRSGIRCLYPLVDVTNYVMIELGQPMHAFDLDKFDGHIVVRNAVHNEKIKLLDETELELNSEDLLICDKSRPLALAGVMGGEDSGICENTTSVLLESAFFSPESIARTVRRYNIISDSSQRFERGVDPSITKKAIVRATELLLEIAGCENTKVNNIQENIDPAFNDKLSHGFYNVDLTANKIKKVLGISIPEQQLDNILKSLGLNLISKDDINGDTQYKWQIPTHRFDLRIEEDLIEELARVYGYNNIPNIAPKRDLVIKTKQPEVVLKQKARETLTNLGFSEILTYSFIDNKLQPYFGGDKKVLKLVNPISSEMGELRTSLCPGLIKVAEYNTNHKIDDLKLFEIGKSFELGEEGNCIEYNKLAGILTGKACLEHWDKDSRKVDFYDAKGYLEIFFKNLGLIDVSFKVDKDKLLPGLHPGQTAQLSYNDKYIGWLGAMHPSVKNKIDLDNAVILFEINLDELQIPSYNSYKGISKYPQIRRDLAFLFKNEIEMQELYDIVNGLAGDLLQNMYIFDIYTGEGVPEGYKSVAFAVILQHHEKTLVDDQINQLVDSIIQQVEQRLGGKLRE